MFFDTDEQLTAPTPTQRRTCTSAPAGPRHWSRSGHWRERALAGVLRRHLRGRERVIFATDEALAGRTRTPTSTSTSATAVRSGCSPPRMKRGSRFDALFVGASRDGRQVFFESHEQLAASDTDVRWTSSSDGCGNRQGPAGNGAFDAMFAWRGGGRLTRALRDRGVAAGRGHRRRGRRLRQRGHDRTRLDRTGGRQRHRGRLLRGRLRRRGARVLQHGGVLVAADSDAVTDVYERAAGTTSLVSTGPSGGNGAFDAPSRASATARPRSSRRASSSAPVTPTPRRHLRRSARSGTRGRRARGLRVASSPPTSMHRAEPHARPAAGIRLLCATGRSPHRTYRRHPRRERQPTASVGSMRLVTLAGDPATPIGRGGRGRVALDHRRARERRTGDYTGELTYALSVRITDRDGPATRPRTPRSSPGACAPPRPPMAARARPRRPSTRSCPARSWRAHGAIWQLEGRGAGRRRQRRATGLSCPDTRLGPP